MKIWVGEDEITGRITEVEGDSVTLDIDGTPSEYSLGDIRKAVIQVEMNRKDS